MVEAHPFRRFGSVSVGLVIALSAYACAPSPLESTRSPAPPTPEPSSSVASQPLTVASFAAATPPPNASSGARSRPKPSSKEPLAPTIDFAWKGTTTALRTHRSKGGPPDGWTGEPDGLSARGSMWGDEVGDAGGGGGLGLSGVGEGGGGIGLGSIGTIGHGAGMGSGAGFGSGSGRLSGRLSGSHATRRDSSTPFVPPGIRTGEWDDDANYIEFQRYLGTTTKSHAAQLSIRGRRFLVVRDADGKGVPNCPVRVDGLDKSGAKMGSETFMTLSSGRALFFPEVEIPEAARYVATASCAIGEGDSPSQAFDSHASDGVVELNLTSHRSVSEGKTVDVAFILDTTGSMSEEISAVTGTIEKVSSVLNRKGLTVRLGLVEYRDRTDPFVTRVHPMTRDVAGFVGQIKTVSAGGGGDTPEDVNAGISTALDELAWNPDSVARLGFIIGDAPPHLDYPTEPSYVESMRRASHDGIQLYTVAASGMDDLGQTVFRQIAMYTSATNLFIMRGGAGPDSVGGGDPKSSCGGTQKVFHTSDMDKIITGKVEQAIALVDANPMIIPGLGSDVIAKPCR